MDKKKKYTVSEEDNNRNKVEEPAVEYHRSSEMDNRISKEELSMNCLTLDESKRLMLERIQQDFQK